MSSGKVFSLSRSLTTTDLARAVPLTQNRTRLLIQNALAAESQEFFSQKAPPGIAGAGKDVFFRHSGKRHVTRGPLYTNLCTTIHANAG